MNLDKNVVHFVIFSSAGMEIVALAVNAFLEKNLDILMIDEKDLRKLGNVIKKKKDISKLISRLSS